MAFKLNQKLTFVTADKVRETKAFKSQSKVRQKVILNRNNLKALDWNLKQAYNIGYEAWNKTTAANQWNKNIVQELLTTINEDFNPNN